MDNFSADSSIWGFRMGRGRLSIVPQLF